jgi:hypothetical protein
MYTDMWTYQGRLKKSYRSPAQTLSVSTIQTQIQMREKWKCILCNGTFTGYGNNPEPLADAEHECCDNCNTTRVVPYRIYQLTKGV